MSFSRKIFDSVHGFIKFNDLESELIDSAPFQRLHYIRQLGIAYLVYPGATHTRFEHSLGVMELATQIFDRILSKKPPGFENFNIDYWKQIVRFAALCHDLGHLPFSHVAEQAVLGKSGHELWSLEFIRSTHLKPVWDKFRKLHPKQNVMEDIVKISIGESKLLQLGHAPFSNWEKVLSHIISGDFFGADRMDYLIRDAKCTGVSYGIFDYHQLIETLCLLPSINKVDQLELGIDENGVEACEALLLARHFMHKRVYQYPSVKAYSFHLIRFMQSFYHSKKITAHLDVYLSMTDNEVMTALNEAARNHAHQNHRDAFCFITRQARFKAIEVEESFSERELKKIQKKLAIPADEIFYEDNHNKNISTGFSFPLINRHGSIGEAKNSSALLIPSRPKKWIYIEPRYAEQLKKTLENGV